MEARYMTDLEWLLNLSSRCCHYHTLIVVWPCSISCTRRICHAVNIYLYRNGKDGEAPILVHIPPAKKKNMRSVMNVIQERVKFPVGFAAYLYKMDGKRVRHPCEMEMYNNYVVASNYDKVSLALFYTYAYENGKLLLTYPWTMKSTLSALSTVGNAPPSSCLTGSLSTFEFWDSKTRITTNGPSRRKQYVTIAVYGSRIMEWWHLYVKGRIFRWEKNVLSLYIPHFTRMKMHELKIYPWGRWVILCPLEGLCQMRVVHPKGILQ